MPTHRNRPVSSNVRPHIEGPSHSKGRHKTRPTNTHSRYSGPKTVPYLIASTTQGVFMYQTFVNAIHSKNKIRLTFYSKDDGAQIVRTCAPMDYGPSRRAANKSDRFHLWDYDSDTKSHTLSLLPDQIVSIEVLSENFDPAGFITWNTTTSPWFVPRGWDSYS